MTTKQSKKGVSPKGRPQRVNIKITPKAHRALVRLAKKQGRTMMATLEGLLGT